MKHLGRSLLLLTGLLAVLPAAAHELQTVALRLAEQSGGRVSASLITPLTRDGRANAVVPRFDPRCRELGESAASREKRRIVRSWQLYCAGGLTGTQLKFEGLDPRTPEALVSVSLADGSSHTYAVDRHDPVVVLHAGTAANLPKNLSAYLPIGIEHILLGPDHLLFVLGLMLVVFAAGHSMRMLIIALTAFTLAHSLTLALAVLGVWGLPPKPVELMIALSIALLAMELAGHGNRGARGLPPTLTMRKPWVVAFGFGLLHGFGFAGALNEIGLPAEARGWALFLFNVGVELGQLLFVAGALLGLATLRTLVARPLPARYVTGLVLLLGGVAVFWTLDRGAAWIGAIQLIAGEI